MTSAAHYRSRRGAIRHLVLLGAISVALHASPARAAVASDPEVDRHPTRILARLHPGRPQAASPTASAAASTLAAHGMRIARHSALVPGLVVLEGTTDARAATAHASTSLQERIASLRRTGLFAYVEPDYALSIEALPGDTRFADGTLWGLHNTGQAGGTAGIDVDAVRAWEVTTGSRNVIVAVIDTGIDYTHTELREQMWQNPGEIPENRIDDDGNGLIDDVFGINVIAPLAPPLDDHNHGTHVAGTIGAAADDGHPHVGVAWQVRLMACKFLDSEGSGYTSDAVGCIDYAARHGADIINASWGGGGYSQALVDSISAAGGAGVLFVAAAGNSGLDLQSTAGERYPAYPAGYDLDSIVAVAAIDRRGELASFSNFGRLSVDLGAPGVDIFSSTALQGKESYATYRGTSMAAPHVAGVAALALARHPDLTPHELKALLLESAKPTASLAGRTVSGGRVNAYGAVSATPGTRLAIALSLPATHVASAGKPFLVTAYVTDLHAVTGALVTGTTDQGEDLVFRDDGVAPDATAADAVYSTTATARAGADTIAITANATLAGRTPASAAVEIPVLNPPLNDDFATPSVLAGRFVRLAASNVGATSEPGEPSHASERAGASLWWTWTAPADCTVSLVTSNTQLDTLLAVYTGDTLAALTPVASNNDAPASAPQSEVAFSATAGTVYRIAVDGWGGAADAFDLLLITSLPPANDAFAASVTLTGSDTEAWGTTILATNEPGETSSRSLAGGSTWYTWTASASGTAILRLDTYYEASDTIEVYSGSDVASLTPVPNLTAGLYTHWDLYTFHATAGATYRVAIRPISTVAGHHRLRLLLKDPPANDNFSGRTTLAGEDISVEYDNLAATTEPGEPVLHSDSSTSIWYSWTAPRHGTALVSIPIQTPFFTALAAYTGTSTNALTRVAIGDQEPFMIFVPNYGNNLVFAAEAGVTYSIMVNGIEGGAGTGTLTLRLVDPPANDRLSAATPFEGADFTTAATNRGATGSAEEPWYFATRPPEASVWWSWTAPATGYLALATSTTAFRPMVRLYEVSGGTPGGSLSDSLGSFGRSLFQVTAGRNYLLSIDADIIGRRQPWLTSTDGMRGDFTLHAVMVPPPNDTFASRETLVGTEVAITDSSIASRPNYTEPSVAGASSRAPLWWSWTAPITGRAVMSTEGSDHDTTMAIFTGAPPTVDSRIAANDNDSHGRMTSELSIGVQAGTTYHVLVDSVEGTGGRVVLSIRCAPAPTNDDFAQRIPMPVTPTAASGSNRGASNEAAEPRHAFSPATSSVWWTWTAPASGDYAASTGGSDFDTRLGVYTGDSVDRLRWITGNDDARDLGRQSRVVFAATAGTTYQIAVDGYRGSVGTVVLALAPHGMPSPAVGYPGAPILAGSPLTLSTETTGSGPFTYQWRRNGIDIAGATAATWTVPIAQAYQSGSYTVIVTNPSGSIASEPAVVTVRRPPPSQAMITNISTRALCLGGDDVLIPGFVVSGTGTKRMLVRAVGPELSGFGITGVLPDPAMVLLRRNGDQFDDYARNDNWGENANAAAIRSTASTVGAFPLAESSRSAALLLDLPAGAYTAIANGAGTSTGIAMVEVYDVAAATGEPSPASLVNLSNRGYAGAGSDVMIPGFVVAGDAPRTFLLRAVGPTLTQLGVTGTLADPRLVIFSRDTDTGAETPILANDTWGENGDATDIADTATHVGAFPLQTGGADAALVITLPPGVYTAHATGKDTVGGVVLVELYLVP